MATYRESSIYVKIGSTQNRAYIENDEYRGQTDAYRSHDVYRRFK
jgi:hypothetical protein